MMGPPLGPGGGISPGPTRCPLGAERHIVPETSNLKPESTNTHNPPPQAHNTVA